MQFHYKIFLVISLFVNSYCRLLSLCLLDYPLIRDDRPCQIVALVSPYEYHHVEKRFVAPLDDEQNVTTSNPEDIMETTITSTLSNEKENINSSSASPTLLNETEATLQNVNNTFDPDSAGEIDIDVSKYNLTALYEHHRYYQSYSTVGAKNVEKYWVDFNLLDQDVQSNEMLSSAHRRALTVTLSFQFPFYGHILRNVTIATGGFLFTGAFLHKWLAATQYIAPLMANFDTSVSSEATVKYRDNGTSLTVQWENVVLQDNPENGTFTFQATLHSSGHIVFTYKEIPMLITLIKDDAHPVKVGLSDAYIVDKTIFYNRRKTIYEYHKIDMKKGMKIGNWTAVVFEPVPNCVTFSNCVQCLLESTTFRCGWCQSVGRCSDGMDRHRQEWLEGGCIDNTVTNHSECAFLPPPPPRQYYSNLQESQLEDKSGEVQTLRVLVGFLIFFVMVITLVVWFIYAYFNPHTSSGQFLIKYRPSSWSWRRGHARYTAATMQSVYM